MTHDNNALPERPEFTVDEALRIADQNADSYKGVASVSRTLAAEVRRLTELCRRASAGRKAVYQLSTDGMGGWLDCCEAEYQFATKYGRIATRVLYTAPELPKQGEGGGEAVAVLEKVRDQIPHRVQSDSFDDLNEEELSIFDNGYNAALTRIHNVLNMTAAALVNVEHSTARGSLSGGLTVVSTHPQDASAKPEGA